jgi:hypothetical protein
MSRKQEIEIEIGPGSVVAAICVVGAGVLVGFFALRSGDRPAPPLDPQITSVNSPAAPLDRPNPYTEVTPNVAAQQVIDVLQTTPEGRAQIERIGDKDVALSDFQRANAISDRIAEAAIKEWVQTHNGNFDWALGEVKSICLRNKLQGIPRQYLPESEK